MPDLEYLQEQLEEARTDILEGTAQGNINREHHFLAWMDSLREVEVLWKAQRILEDLYKEDDSP